MTKDRTTAITRAQAANHLGKAQQFLDEARFAMEGGRYDACVLNAIHAAISAVDAITGMLGGERSCATDHQKAAALLESYTRTIEGGPEHVRQFRQLLMRKNATAYDDRRTSDREASDALSRAARMVEWAHRIVHR